MWHRVVVVAYGQYYSSYLEQAELGVQLSNGKKVGGILFANEVLVIQRKA